jgi:hypothetical protein
MAKTQLTKVKGCKKCGRTKKRRERAGSPISLFVRNKIQASEYFKLIGQSVKL